MIVDLEIDFDRIEETQANWDAEAAQAALDGNPRRAWYLNYMAGQLPRLIGEQQQRAVARGETL